MEEFNKALPDKNYVEAANMLELVRATNTSLAAMLSYSQIQVLFVLLYMLICGIFPGKDQCGLTESVEALPAATGRCSQLRTDGAEGKFNLSPGR